LDIVSTLETLATLIQSIAVAF